MDPQALDTLPVPRLFESKFSMHDATQTSWISRHDLEGHVAIDEYR